MTRDSNLASTCWAVWKACALAQEQSHVVMTNISDHRKGQGRGEGMVFWVACSEQEEKDVIWGMLLLDTPHGPRAPLLLCNSSLGHPVINFRTEQAEHSRRQRHPLSHTQARMTASNPFLT